jgi:hypothetical protein
MTFGRRKRPFNRPMKMRPFAVVTTAFEPTPLFLHSALNLLLDFRSRLK